MARHSTPSSKLLRIGAAILIAAIAEVAPSVAVATPVTSAANIPYSANGGVYLAGSNGEYWCVNLATGECCVQYRETDLAFIGSIGPMPVEFHGYYASMLAREGLASGHLGTNWLGTYDWSLSVSGPMVNVVTNRGQLIQFQQNVTGGYDLLRPTNEKYQLALVGPMYRLTYPSRRRVYLFDSATRLLSQILDAHGNSLNLSYSGGFLSQVTDGLGRTLTFSYDVSGNVTMVSDGTRSVSYAYTGSLLTGVTDAAGHTRTYAYGPGPIQGLLIGVTEPLGNSPLTQAYDSSGRVTSQTDALGNTSTYAYDAPSGNVFTDPLGNAWTYRHDPYKLTALIDPAVGTTSFTYDASGRLATMTRPLGDMTSFAYDAASGYPSRIIRTDGTLVGWGYSSHTVGGATLFDVATATYPDGASESYGRDAAGNLTDFADRSGFHWLGTYNPRGQLLTGTNPSGGVTTLGYASNFTVVLLSDNAGNATSFSYDALSRLTQITWPGGSARSFAYDNVDHVTGVADERGKLWSYAYDANERLMTTTDPLLRNTQLVWDSNDRLSQVVDPLGRARVYAYDPAGSLASMTDRTGNMTSYQYDALGRLLRAIDPAGGANTYSYDANSREVAAQDPLGHSTSFGYDMLDRMIHMTDPVGTGIDYTYDAMGRLLTATAPLGHMERFGYDPRGLLTSFFDVTSETDFARTPLGEVSQLTDPNRNVWPRSYDPQGRLTGSADPLARGRSYAYDSRSRPIRIQRPDGSIRQVVYDPAGHVTGESYSGGPSFAYTYDDANRLLSATGASFAYDAAGRMTSSNGLTMTYDNEGRITSETYAPGKVVSYSYNSRGLLTGVTDWIGGATSFTYDAAQRLTGIMRPNGTTATYGYDSADRLILSVELPPNPNDPPLASIAITRDALGRPTSIDRRQPLMPGATSPATTSFTYDAASQINGFSWDPLGRLVSDGTRSFQWDGASRLMHYVAGADSPSFSYDAFGRMLTRTLGSTTEQYVWNYADGRPKLQGLDDRLMFALGRPTLDAVYQGATPLRYYIHTPSGLLLHSVDAATGARLFYHYDESGNTIFLTNTSSSIQTEYAYTPFGGVTALGQTGTNPFTFGAAAGAVQVGTSGLFSRYGSTIFDAVTKRVISGISTQSGPIKAARSIGRSADNTDQPCPPQFTQTYSFAWSIARAIDGVSVGGVHSVEGIESTDGRRSGGVPTLDCIESTDGQGAFRQRAYMEVMWSDLYRSNPGPTVFSADDDAAICPTRFAQNYSFAWSIAGKPSASVNPGPINSPGSWVTKDPGPPNEPVIRSSRTDVAIHDRANATQGIIGQNQTGDWFVGCSITQTAEGRHGAGQITEDRSITQTGDWFVGRSHGDHIGDLFVGYGPGGITPITGDWDGL